MRSRVGSDLRIGTATTLAGAGAIRAVLGLGEAVGSRALLG
jgi:hypothetical protein